MPRTRSMLTASAVVIALVAALVVTSSVSYAKGAKSVLLGKANKSAAGTTLKRTGAGPALTLTTKAGSPPLAVSSPTKVPNLNADLVDGLDSATLSPATKTYTASFVAGSSDGFKYLLTPAPGPGTYRFDVNAALVPSDADATIGFCGISFDGDIYVSGASAPMQSSTGFRATISSSAVLTKPTGPVTFACQANDGLMAMFASELPTVSVTPVRARTSTAMTPVP